MRVDFYSHCLDSWVLANQLVGGHIEPENKHIKYLEPLNFFRRQLHAFCPNKTKVRRPYGGTRSLGLKRGTLIVHPKYKHCLVGGTSKDRLSLHDITTNKRLCQNAKKQDLKILTNFTWCIN